MALKVSRIQLSFFCIFTTQAQVKVPTPQQIEDFYKTETLVVLDGTLMSEYSAYLQAAFNSNWTITPFRFITANEFETLRKDPKYSFAARAEFNFKKQDKINVNYEFLTIVLGGNYATLTDMPEMASIPLAYKGTDEATYSYKLPALVSFLQNHIELVKSDPSLTDDNIVIHYNKSLTQMDGKELLLIQSELSPEFNSIDKIKKEYNGDIQFTTQDDISAKIESHEAIVFLHKVGPGSSDPEGRCWKMLIGAQSGFLYYWDYHQVTKKKPNSLLLTDFRRLENKQ